MMKLSLKKSGYKCRENFQWGKGGNTVGLCIESFQETIPCYQCLSLDGGIMGDFHFYYYIFLFCKISTVYMLLNHQEKSVVENWSKSLLDLIYQCFNLPHFYNSCFAFFKLLISHGRNKRHQLPFPSLISLAFQVTHPWCSTAGGILRDKHIIYRSGN